MRLELRVRAQWLRVRMLNELRRVAACVAELLNNGTVVVDRIELAEAAALSRHPDGTISIATQDGNSAVPGSYHVRFHQPVLIRLVGVTAMESNNAAPTVPFTVQVQIVMRLRFGLSAAGQARFRIEYVSADLGPLGQLLADPGAVTEQINAAAQSTAQTPWVNLPVEDLSDALGETMVVTNMGVAVTANSGEMLVFRVEINGPYQSALSDWTAFYANNFPLDLPAGLDWQVFVHKGLFVKVFGQRVQDGLEAAEANGQFLPSPGFPSSTWLPLIPSIQVAYSGEIPDACTVVVVVVPFLVDLDVDVVMDFIFSVPAPNELRVTIRVYWDLADGEVFACAISSLLFWPIVATYTLLEGDSVQCDEDGYCIDTIVTGTFLTPVAIFVGILWASGTAQPEGLSFAGFDEIEDTDADLELRQNFTGFDLPLGMELTEVSGVSDGLQLGGTLPLPATVAHPAELMITGVSQAFQWHFADICGTSPRFTASAFINYRNAVLQQPDHTPLQLCRIEVLDDPDNRYAPFLQVETEAGGEQGSIQFHIPHGAAQTEDPGYPCKVLIVSTGGARIITIAGYNGVSEELLVAYKALLEAWRLLNCRSWAEVKESEIYHPTWDIDPPPFQTGLQEVLTISVEEAGPGSVLTAANSAGEDVARSVVASSGRARFVAAGHTRESVAQLSIEVRPGQVPESLEGEGASAPEAEGGGDGDGKLGIFKQNFSLERILPEAKVSHVSLGRLGKRKVLYAVSGDELLVFDVSEHGSAKLVFRIASQGATGFVPLRDGGILWGSEGSHFVSLEPEPGPLTPTTQRPVRAAAYLKNRACLLEDDGIVAVDADCKALRRMRLDSPQAMIAAGGNLYVAQEGRLSQIAFSLSEGFETAAGARIESLVGLDPLHELDKEPAILLRQESGMRAVRFSSGELVELARYDQLPPLATATRLGALRAYVDKETGVVLARSYGGRPLNELEILNAEKIDTSRLPMLKR